MQPLRIRRCDFQIHSPRDPHYRGWPEEKMTLDGLYEWGRCLLLECRKRGLTAISVTDHHDLLAALVTLEVCRTEGYDDIWVFPGMEITSSLGLQAILLLDPSLLARDATVSSTEPFQVRVQTIIGQHISVPAEPARQRVISSWADLESLVDVDPGQRSQLFKLRETERLSKSLEEIAAGLEEQLADKFVLLPNLEKSKHGIFENQAGQALYRSDVDWFVGGIISGGKGTNLDVLRGKCLKDWGGRKVVCIRTSDQRGKGNVTWFSDEFASDSNVSHLKLSSATTQSVTEALLSGEDRRVFQSPPTEPADRIERLWVKGARIFDNGAMEASFSPGLNPFIGGRGTGKSILLSALVRLFGADKEWMNSGGESPSDLALWEKRHVSLFEDGGPFCDPETELGVEYVKSPGVRFKLTVTDPYGLAGEMWRLETQADSEWLSLYKGSTHPDQLDVMPLFFLQGQMSALTGSESDQQDITRLVEGSMRDERETLRTHLQSLSDRVKSGFDRQNRLKTLRKEKAAFEVSLAQKTTERTAYIAAAQKGLTEDEARLFNLAEPTRQAKAALESLEAAVAISQTGLKEVETTLRSALSQARQTLGQVPAQFDALPEDTYAAGLQSLADRLVAELKALRETTEEEIAQLAPAKALLAGKVQNVLAKAKAYGDAEAQRKVSIEKADKLLAEIKGLEESINGVVVQTDEIKKSGDIEAGQSALADYDVAVREYSRKLLERAKSISNTPGLRLHVKITPGGNFKRFLAELKATCAGCNVKSDTWAELESKLAASPHPADVISNLIKSALKSFEDPEKAERPQEWADAGFTAIIFRNVITKTSAEAWAKLAVVLAEDKVEVLYRRGAGLAPIPIRKASPGERAVELLRLALSSTKGPLVIDQPEDDLDNEFLANQLVALVHDAKRSNQLIFASHNANLVVHGDSEIIHVMGTKGEGSDESSCFLWLSGTIDETNVCLEIEKTMEGGRTAFEQRRRKYHETVAPALLNPGAD